jgi:hypothetical protein
LRAKQPARTLPPPTRPSLYQTFVQGKNVSRPPLDLEGVAHASFNDDCRSPGPKIMCASPYCFQCSHLHAGLKVGIRCNCAAVPLWPIAQMCVARAHTVESPSHDILPGLAQRQPGDLVPLRLHSLPLLVSAPLGFQPKGLRKGIPPIPNIAHWCSLAIGPSHLDSISLRYSPSI